MSKKNAKPIVCETWSALQDRVNEFRDRMEPGEYPWFRGINDRSHALLPSLMRMTQGLVEADHAQVESDLFFTFQAKAHELREQHLDDWECLFHARHFGLPTRVLDWTQTLYVALYFAAESWSTSVEPALWLLDPWELNEQNWGVRDIILPRYLGYDDDIDDYWSLSELLGLSTNEVDRWFNDKPVAVYPVQTNVRVRAQRGWFTVHGNSREPLDRTNPDCVMQLVLGPTCMKQIRDMLEQADYNQSVIYPDLEHLTRHITSQVQAWIERPTRVEPAGKSRVPRPKVTSRHRRRS